MRGSYNKTGALLGVLAIFACHCVAQSVERSPEAATVLNQSFKSLGATIPPSTSVLGNFTQEVGGTRDEGLLNVLTRGSEETSETYTVGSKIRTVVYSYGSATEKVNGIAKRMSLERSLASKSVMVPIVLIGSALQDPSYTVQYIAAETLTGRSVHHLRIIRNILPDGAPAELAAFSTKDIWIDAQTLLPRVISWEQHDSRGDAPALLYTLSFSDFRAVQGAMFPFSITETLNDTRYLTITITSASIGIGLSDSDFSL